MIKNTNKWACRQIAAALEVFGIKHIVTSPGSRNVPLLMATARSNKFNIHSIIDERSAAFIALGLASVSETPVALICTSGTAMLNYAPAVAEAYYRKIPLIAITADRPAQWINQDDSQTIRQANALQNIVKHSVEINGDATDIQEKWHTNRLINDALISATSGKPGPVHINVALSAPLSEETIADDNETFRKISILERSDTITDNAAEQISLNICNKKVLIVAGFNSPSNTLDTAIEKLAKLPNVAVLAENVANINAKGCIQASDSTLYKATKAMPQELKPDVLITFGGSLVSVSLKTFLRNYQPTEHFHIGINDATIDCFMSLTQRVETSPQGFLCAIAKHLSKLADSKKCNYAELWHKVWHLFSSPIPESWCALSAVNKILNSAPQNCNLQLSNGMSIRYAQTCNLPALFNRIDCNRGVSGIDGSVSTAVGAAIAYKGQTLLITGDMSMQYDIAALSTPNLPATLKIAVLNNNGGGIFKFVKTTANLAERPSLINGKINLPLKQLADAYGLKYICADNHESLSKALPLMWQCNDKSVLLEIITDVDVDTEFMNALYKID